LLISWSYKGIKAIKTKGILDIIDENFMQSVQDFFAETMDVALVSVHENIWLTDPSNSTVFCRKYTRRSLDAYSLCEDCHKKWEKVAIEKKVPVIVQCHVGLTNFTIPVILNNEHVATIVGGQVLLNPPEEGHFRQIAKKFGFDENEYVEAAKDLKIFSEEKLKRITDLIFLVANSFCSVVHANSKLEELGLDYRLNRNIELEKWFISNYSRVKRKNFITAREHEILKLIVDGKSNNEISKELFISVHTVKAHVSAIIEKFGVDDRVQVAVKAVREGLIS
jgi:ligand-binding sensor protein/DNA-binding CsgD family transcriptional regulator